MIADIYPEYVQYFVFNQTNYPELSHQSYILTLQHTPAGISLSDFRAFPETPHIFLNIPQEIFSQWSFRKYWNEVCSLDSTAKVVSYDLAIQIFSVNVRVCP